MMWFRRALVLAAGLVIAVALLRCRYTVVLNWGDSMSPTFAHGDLLLLDRWAYEEGEPERGDIVVAVQYAGRITKRVIGLPGEQVELRQGLLFIDGACVMERYAEPTASLSIASGSPQDDHYALLGDNRRPGTRQAIPYVVSSQEIQGKVVGSPLLSLP